MMRHTSCSDIIRQYPKRKPPNILALPEHRPVISLEVPLVIEPGQKLQDPGKTLRMPRRMPAPGSWGMPWRMLLFIPQSTWILLIQTETKTRPWTTITQNQTRQGTFLYSPSSSLTGTTVSEMNQNFLRTLTILMKNYAGMLYLSLPMSILDSTRSHVMTWKIQKDIINSLVAKRHLVMHKSKRLTHTIEYTFIVFC